MIIVKSRQFTLLDAMILFVAAAVGMALARGPLNYLLHPPPPTISTVAVAPHSPYAYIREQFGTAVKVATTVYPLVLAFTFAALVLRLRHPRPRLRKILRQPGAVGCSAAIFSFFLAFLTLTPSALHSLGRPAYFGWE